MKKLLTLLIFPLFSFGQNADWKELQAMIEAAKTSPTGIVTVARNYTIDKPLVVANWNGTDYDFVNLTIQGYATMWDNQNRSVIKATFNDAPILSIHKGKGVIVRGVTFKGPGWGRDSRYSPQACIAIDPFRYNKPGDGGYPTLQEWYRGKQSVSGSTGIRVEDCTLDGTVVGIITSPNGYTLNAELCTFQNIRSYSVKYVIVGTQSQEKMNRVINLGAWGPSDYVFYFNKYGLQQPGNWIIDGVNVAGSVKRIIYRYSGGWFPMNMSNVFAESIESIGYWQSTLGDALNNASIQFKEPKAMGYYPDNHLSGQGLTILNSNIRYYGPIIPLLFTGQTIPQGTLNPGGLINALRDTEESIVRQLGRVYNAQISDDRKMTVDGVANRKPGETIIIMDLGNWNFIGMAEVDSSDDKQTILRYVSKSIVSGGNYRIGVKK